MAQVAALELRSADLQSSRNNQEHHTQEMGLQRLIVRRSQSFTIQLHFSRPFHSGTDHITFIAETGPEPTELLGTRATFLLTSARQGNVWSASDFTINANSLSVSLFTPASAVIGPYTLKIKISQGQGHSLTHLLGTFILLFNPWSAEDDVYLPSEILLQEYIMMDYGFVYKGHERFITPWPWNYGQVTMSPEVDLRQLWLFRCGPASVKAIREGEVHLPYDTPFVYAEVNADEVIWLFGGGQALEILAHNISSIGKEISTKMVGSDQRQNITSSYKYPEGSPEERSVFMKASRKMLGSRRASSPFLDLLRSSSSKDQPVQLQLHLAQTPEWGQDLLLELHARRVADRAHPQGPIRLVVRFCAQTLLHSGGTRRPLWRQKVHLTLDFGEEIQRSLSLPYNNYKNKLTDEKLIRVSGIAKVAETGRSMLVLKDISLEPPHLAIEVSERAEVGKALRVHISLTNTLSVALSHCTMVLEGSGLIDGQISNDLGTLVAGHTVQIQLDLYPLKVGRRQLQVLISSKELKEIKGYKDIFVVAAGAS